MPYPQSLATARLELRRWREDDEEAQLAIWSDPEVWNALRAGPGTPAEAAASSHAKQLRHWDEHGFGLWAVIPRGEDEPIGWAGAWYPDFVPELRGEIEIGWALRRPCWGRGFATEAARRATATTFEHLAPDRVISLIAAGNHRSAAVADRLGMRPAGTTTTERGFDLRVFELRHRGQGASDQIETRGASPQSTSSR